MTRKERSTSSKGRRKTRSKKNLEDTDAWASADLEYIELLASDRMPFFGPPLTGEGRIKRLKEILRTCPEYYPVIMELGKRYILMGKDDLARSRFEKGFLLAGKHLSMEDSIEGYYNVCEFLEERFRFRMALEFYERLMNIENDKAKVYDHMSHSHVWLGEYDEAFENMQKTLELCDSNSRYYCNMGWVEMLRGNPVAAKSMLERSLELDESDNITKNNYDVCKLLLKDKKLNNWEDYLLRPVDREYILKLEDEEDWEEHDKQVGTFNYSVTEAFKFELMHNTEYTSHEKNDIIFTLAYIFKFIEEIQGSGYFLYDDMATVSDDFKPIMHKFIFKTGDIDEKIFNDVYSALLEFYGFLAKRKLVSTADYNELKEVMLELKPELMEKMRRYNEIRHNDDYTEEEKEDIRDELFDGDYTWSFL